MPALLQPRSAGQPAISSDGKVGGESTVVPDDAPQVDPTPQQIDSNNPNTPDNEAHVEEGAGDKGEEGGEDFNFDAFQAAKDLANIAPTHKKASEDKDKEVKPDQQQQRTDDQADLDKPQVVPSKKAAKEEPDQRDYSDVPQELVAHFKRMGNDAFNTLKPLFLAKDKQLKEREAEIANLKSGKVTIPDSYYEHPNAFMLTPEYEGALVSANEAQLIYNHWEQQLNSVREGSKTFKPLVRNQQGQLAYGNDMPADANAETKLMALFNSAHNQLMTYQGKLGAVQESYKGNYQNGKKWVEDTEANFKAFADEKSTYALAAKDYIEKNVPKIFHNNPLIKVLAKSLVTNAELFKVLQAADAQMKAQGKNGKNGKATKVAVTRQPTNNDIQNDSGGSSKDNGESGEVTMDDFNRIKNS